MNCLQNCSVAWPEAPTARAAAELRVAKRAPFAHHLSTG